MQITEYPGHVCSYIQDGGGCCGAGVCGKVPMDTGEALDEAGRILPAQVPLMAYVPCPTGTIVRGGNNYFACKLPATKVHVCQCYFTFKKIGH